MAKFLYRITYLVLLLTLFPFLASQAQTQDKSQAQFGVIPDSLYQMQPPASSPDTPYMVTNNEMHVSFKEDQNSIVAIIKYLVRLKVFDKTVHKASIVSIPYYFDNDMERISKIKAQTYDPSGKRIPLQNQNIKTININERYNVKEFTMPQVKDGSILEYSYVIRRRYIEQLPDFYLSHEVPTAEAKVTITYPGYLRYKAFVENFDGTVDHNFAYKDTSSVPKIFVYPQPKPIVTERWSAHNIPAVKKVPYLSSLNDYRGKIRFLLDEFGIPRQPLENSWEVVVRRLRERTHPLQFIQQNKMAKSIGDSIAKVYSSASKKAIQDSIYRYVNEKVNYSGAYAPYSTVNDSTALSGKPADQASINQTLVAMLHGAGIEAHPMLISSRRSGKIDMDFPSFYQFNAQMVYSKIDGQTYFMDASFPHSQPGLVPVDMYSGPGLLLKQDSFEWEDVKPGMSKFDIKVNLDAKLTSKGDLRGSVIAYPSGYAAQRIRKQRTDGMSNVDILKRTLFDGYAKMTANNVTISDIDNYGKPIKILADFTIPDYATSFTDGLKFRPMIVGYRRQNPFKNSSRKLPVTLDAPEKLDVSYSITLPSGYSANSGKENHRLSIPGANFKEDYDINSGKMNYQYHIDIGKKDFSTDEFPQLYRLYQRWVDLSNTAWLLKK